MITLKNVTTAETVSVSSLRMIGDKICAYHDFAEPSEKWLQKYTCVTRTEETVNDEKHGVQCRVFVVSDGWEMVTNERKKRTPKTKVEPKDEPKIEVEEEPKDEPKDEPKVEPKNESKNEPKVEVEDEDEALAREIAALLSKRQKLAKGFQADEVEAVFAGLLAQAAQEQPRATKRALKHIKEKEDEKNEVYCTDFEDIKEDLEDGFNVYLYGPAGCGKSHTAEQLAKKLGLEFYGQTTVQFAHDVKGYGDAGGNFISTPFFKAFSGGGVYFQDEYDRSYAEAAIVLNTALANGWYDFPVVGRVERHPDFRFLAAGNTMMTGADEEYVTGQVQDASAIDRFATMYELDYNHQVELKVAGGDAELLQFIEDVRRAVKDCGIKHIVSYRATAYLSKRANRKEKALKNCLFKTLKEDEVRMIVNRLAHKENAWAKVAAKLK